MNKHQKKTGARFIQLFYWMFDTPAWKDLDAVSRAIYVELTARYNGSNNGRIAFSARQAAEEIENQQGHGRSRAERPPVSRIHRVRKARCFPLQGATRQRISADHLRSNLTDDYAENSAPKSLHGGQKFRTRSLGRTVRANIEVHDPMRGTYIANS